MRFFEYFKRVFSTTKEWPEDDQGEVPLGDLKAGALYSIYNGDNSGQYGVVKILVLKPPVVHLRVYKESFATRPTSLAPAPLLSLEENLSAAFTQFFSPQGLGIAHLPVHVRDFVYGWKPVFLADSPVTEAELAGYRKWQQDGGVFGGR